jgi:hypothetical protein
MGRGMGENVRRKIGAMEIIQTHKHNQSFVLSRQFKTFAMVRHVKVFASLVVYERGQLRIGQDQCNQMSLVGLSSVSMAQFAKACGRLQNTAGIRHLRRRLP